MIRSILLWGSLVGGFQIEPIPHVVAVFYKDMLRCQRRGYINAKLVAEDNEEQRHQRAIALPGRQIGGQKLVTQHATQRIIQIVPKRLMAGPDARLVKVRA